MAKNTKLKLWKILAIFGGVILVIAGVAIPIAYMMPLNEPNDSSNPPQSNVYNGLATNLTNSTETTDRGALEWYQKHTASVAISNSAVNDNNRSVGTAWKWSAPVDSTSYFFATNIRVIKDVLQYDDVNDVWTIMSYTKFEFHNRNGDYSSSTSSIAQEIHKIYAYDEIVGATIPVEYKDINWYSDLVVLETSSEMFKDDDALDFIDTESEFNWFTNSMKSNKNDLIFYLCGYLKDANASAWFDATAWTTVKYQWSDKIASYKDRKEEYKVTNSNAFSSSSGTNDYLTTNGLEIIKNKKYHNYASQLVLPGLNLDAWANGSLLMVKHENTFKAIGMYWNDIKTKADTGIISLFYQPSEYEYSNTETNLMKFPAYNHTTN